MLRPHAAIKTTSKCLTVRIGIKYLFYVLKQYYFTCKYEQQDYRISFIHRTPIGLNCRHRGGTHNARIKLMKQTIYLHNILRTPYKTAPPPLNTHPRDATITDCHKSHHQDDIIHEFITSKYNIYSLLTPQKKIRHLSPLTPLLLYTTLNQYDEYTIIVVSLPPGWPAYQAYITSQARKWLSYKRIAVSPYQQQVSNTHGLHI